MNALTKLAPVMMALCGLMILGIIAALVIWITHIPNQESVTGMIYHVINFIYIAEIAFIATLLWVMKDSIRALSFYFYMFTVICSELITQYMAVSIQWLQVISGAIFLSMINIIIQSYFIKPKELSNSCSSFCWTLLLRHVIFIAYPYYAASHYLSINAYRYITLVNILVYIALLIALIKINRYLDAERINRHLNAGSKTNVDPYSNL